MSHYENGAREPGLNFVCRACDYYGVTADYLRGRTEDPHGDNTATIRAFLNQVRTMIDRADMALDGTGGGLQ